jgi:hypothetical protein
VVGGPAGVLLLFLGSGPWSAWAADTFSWGAQRPLLPAPHHLPSGAGLQGICPLPAPFAGPLAWVRRAIRD